MKLILFLILLCLSLVHACSVGYYDPCGICGGDGSSCSWHGTSVIGLTQVEQVKCAGEMISDNRLCINVTDLSAPDVVVKTKLDCPFDLPMTLISDRTVLDTRIRVYRLCATLTQLIQCDILRRSNDTIDVSVSVDHYRTSAIVNLAGTNPSTNVESGSSSSSSSSSTETLHQISHQSCRLHAYYTKGGSSMTEHHTIGLNVDASVEETYWSSDAQWLYTVIKTCVRKPDIACNQVSLHFKSVSKGGAIPVSLGCDPVCEGLSNDLPPGYCNTGNCCQYWMFKLKANNTCVSDQSMLNFTSVYTAPTFNNIPVSINLKTSVCGGQPCSSIPVPGRIELTGQVNTYTTDSLQQTTATYPGGGMVYAYFRINRQTLPDTVCNSFQVHPFQLSICRWDSATACNTVALLYDSLQSPPMVRFSTLIDRNYPNAVSNPNSALRRNNGTLCSASGFVFSFRAPSLNPEYRHSLVVNWVSKKNEAHYLYRYLDENHSIDHKEGNTRYISEKSRYSKATFGLVDERFETASCDLVVSCSGDHYYDRLGGGCRGSIIVPIFSAPLLWVCIGVILVAIICVSVFALTSGRRNPNPSRRMKK